MGLLDRVRDALPGIVPADGYDDGYPQGVAGHVASGADVDTASDIVRTPLGVDVGFDGSKVEDRDPREGHEGLGYEHVNEGIHKVARESKEKDSRKPVSTVADSANYGNMTLPDSTAKRVLIRNSNRKDVTITNQGTSLIVIGRGSGISVTGPSPNTCYLPAGSARTFSHREEIWLAGTSGGIVDWVEENYG